ncbi:MAG: ABC transporter ATP-binding protein [Pseudomonadota bacterium]
MNNFAIKAHNISKMYHIGSKKRSDTTVARRMLDGALKPIQRMSGLVSGRAGAAADLDREFWALKDVSFTIGQGERVAIIGRNGAGKSTLLKVLSRITQPTSGTASIRGRLGSLLEVGTGFHPELTGRENVFLNGSILGMRETEVRSKFDAIVDFSEVEQFLDTPVKHYSSGMRVRLAFSVAAHLQPEVLIVDEVLSVGDIAFRKKCMEQLHKVASEGATVLVVSHNVQTVLDMCDRAIWMQSGQIVKDGQISDVMSEYLGLGMGLSAESSWDPDEAPGGEIARIRSVRLLTAAGVVSESVDVRDPLIVESEIEVLQEGYGLVYKHHLVNGEGAIAFSALDTENPIWKQKTWAKGTYRLRMHIPGNFLQADSYSIEALLWAWEPKQILQCHERNVASFYMVDNFNGGTARSKFVGNMHGVVRPLLKWDMEHETAKVNERGEMVASAPTAAARNS